MRVGLLEEALGVDSRWRQEVPRVEGRSRGSATIRYQPPLYKVEAEADRSHLVEEALLPPPCFPFRL